MSCLEGELLSWASPVGLTPCGDVSGGAIPAFLQWCGKEKVRLPKCCIANSKNTGRCVRATSAIAQGEVVVEVPDDAVLMSENCSIAELLEDYGLCKPSEDPILEVQGLIIALMHERNLKSKSRWCPYLDFMPTDMTHLPMYWNPDEVSELQGTVALDLMEGLVQQPADAPTRVNEMWREVAEPFVAENPQLGLPTGEAGQQLYRWATAVVSSYSFMLGDERYQSLVPVWDALNHVTGRANVRLHHVERRGVLQMIAVRDIAAGEEVVNNYGALSNSELLRAYGYVERLGGSQAAGAGSSHCSDLHALELQRAGCPNNAHSNVQVPFKFVLEVCRSISNQEPESKVNQGQAMPGTSASGKVPISSRAEKAQQQEAAAPESDRSSDGCVRFCRRHKLLGPKRIFKLFHDRGPDASLTEVMRLLLLPPTEFKEFSHSISSWRPPMALPMSIREEAAQQVHDGGPGSHGLLTKGDSAAAPASKSTCSSGQTSRSLVHKAYLLLIEMMTSRYQCSLEADLRVLSNGKTLAALPPRLQAAIVARADEKACWARLRAWLDQPDADLKLARQSSDAWKKALAFSRKSGRVPGCNLEPTQAAGGEQAPDQQEKRALPNEVPKGGKICKPQPAAEAQVTAFSFNFALD